MLSPVSLRLLSILALAASAGCATQTELFLHRAHRSNYALHESELKQMQFYLSSEVLAHEIGGAAASGVMTWPGFVSFRTLKEGVAVVVARQAAAGSNSRTRR